MAILKDLIVNGASRFIGDAYFNTIKAGVWNGTAIDVAHGGTGLTTFSSAGLVYASGNTAFATRAILATSNNETTITSSSTDLLIPTAKNVYTAILNGFSANDAMQFAGTFDGSSSAALNDTALVGTFHTTSGITPKTGATWRVSTSGYYGKGSDEKVEVGDLIILVNDNFNASNNLKANFVVIQKNMNIDDYVTLAGPQTITGAKTFNAETTFNQLSTFNKGLISTSVGDSDTDVLFVSGNSSFNDIVNIYGLTNHGNHVIPMNNNAYDLGSSSLKWRNIYAGSVTATTFTGNLSGNASSATTASSVAWDGVTNKPINFKAYFGSLASGGWKAMQGRDAGKVLSISYNNGVADWNSGTYSASLVYGVNDTRGLLDLSYNAPIVTFGGSSISGSTDDNPSWYIKLTGTSGTTYNLNSMPYATSAGNAGQVKTVASSSNASYYLTFVDSNNSSATAESVYTNSGLSYNPNSKTLTTNVFSGSLSGVATLSSMLRSHYGISSSASNAQGHWFKFATLSFNDTAWAQFDEWLFFGSIENTTYCPNGILRISGRQSNNLGYAAQFEIYWISLGNIWYRDKVVAIKTANCVFDLYISNYDTYESICIYRMANSSTYQRLVFNNDNNRSWIATLPTPAAATVSGEKTTVTSSLAGYSYSADKLTTSRTLTIGNSSKTFDGSGNISWTLSDIGAASSSSLGNYLPLSGGIMTGAIKRSYTSASDDPVLNIASANQDIWLWRVSGSSYSTSSAAGFGLKYLGTGSGELNNLALFADNLKSDGSYGDQIQAITISQAGHIGIGTTPTTSTGNLVKVNGNIEASKFIGSLNYSFTLTLNGGSTEGTNKFTFNNSASKSVSIYAPTSAGSLNLILVANNSGIPTWLTGYPVIDCYHSSNSDINSGLWDQVKKVSSPMKVHFYDVYNDGGPTTFGNVMEIVGRIDHWQPLLWFDSGTTGSVRHRNIHYNSTDWGSWYLFSDSGNSSLSTSSNVVSLKLLNLTASVYNTTYIDNLSLYANTTTTSSSIKLYNNTWTLIGNLIVKSLESGTYMVSISTNSSQVASGFFSAIKNTEDYPDGVEEIPLHYCGVESGRFYAGTQKGKFVMSSKVTELSARIYTITFKRII